MSAVVDRFLDQLCMLSMGSKGTTQAHMFLQDRAAYPMKNAKEAEWHGARVGAVIAVFIPPKPEDRVMLFEDNSGVYVHKDGFCTPMGDISKEVHAWQQVR